MLRMCFPISDTHRYKKNSTSRTTHSNVIWTWTHSGRGCLPQCFIFWIVQWTLSWLEIYFKKKNSLYSNQNMKGFISPKERPCLSHCQIDTQNLPLSLRLSCVTVSFSPWKCPRLRRLPDIPRFSQTAQSMSLFVLYHPGFGVLLWWAIAITGGIMSTSCTRHSLQGHLHVLKMNDPSIEMQNETEFISYNSLSSPPSTKPSSGYI